MRENKLRKAQEADNQLVTGEAAGQINSLKKQHERLLFRYKQKKLELEDLDKELFEEKFEYLELIRSQKKEVKFLTKVLGNILLPEDVDKLRLKSKWDDLSNSFDVPGFLMNAKKISFPHIPKKTCNFFALFLIFL